MKILKSRAYLVIVVALITLSVLPQLGSATLVWSETFDELDSEIWSTIWGELEGGCLRGIVDEGISIYRNSAVTDGTWKFELRKMTDWTVSPSVDNCHIYFICIDVPSLSQEYIALTLKQSFSGETEVTTYSIDKYDGSHSYLDTYTGEAITTVIGVLHRFAITRTAGGLISVYLNDSLILQATDTDMTDTEYFGFWTRDDWAFDNIEVYDSIEIGSGSPLILLAAGAGVVVVVIAVVLFVKRR